MFVYELSGSGFESSCSHHIYSFEELLSKGNTFTIHEQNIQNLAMEMFKALNDLLSPDFSELFQLNE